MEFFESAKKYPDILIYGIFGYFSNMSVITRYSDYSVLLTKKKPKFIADATFLKEMTK